MHDLMLLILLICCLKFEIIFSLHLIVFLIWREFFLAFMLDGVKSRISLECLKDFKSLWKESNISNRQCEMEEKASSGLLGKLLGAFDGLRALLEGWEHAFDWEKAKEEGLHSCCRVNK